MKQKLLVLILLPLAACDFLSSPDDAEPLSESAVLAHLNYLASDNMYGRLYGTEYELQAAEYIRDKFIDHGLEPGVPGYFQDFDIEIPIPIGAGNESQNVIGVLPGQGDLAEEWVIVGAHYDHVGWIQVDDSTIAVVNGADDNASGTSLMLEIARYMKEYVAGGGTGNSDRRSIMFHAYGAEEAGMVGSYHFCGNPTVPMAAITAMLNLDMVGRLRSNALTLIATSSSLGWEEVAEAANTYSLNIDYSPANSGRSDQACFYEAGNPVMFLHTGMHPEYHTPDDDVQLINTEGMVRIGNYTIALLLDLILRAEPLPYTGNVPEELLTAAERFELRN
jgi:hypothetical protein